MISSTARSGSSAIVPAPWSLRADGYAFVLRLPMPRGRGELFASDELAEARFGPFGLVMFVDYVSSPVGPYRELLVIPGSFGFGRRRLPAVTKIYVSSQPSVDSGRHNWGLPKERASFEVERDGQQRERVRMHVGGEPAVEFTVRHHAPSLPVASWLIPARLRTLGQVLDGQTFEVSPSGRGQVRRATVEQAWSNPALFVALSRESIVAAVRLSKVRLTFPRATIR